MQTYTMPWRPVYEGWAAAGWLAAAAALAAELASGITPTGPLWGGITVTLALALARGIPAWRLWRWQRRLRGQPLTFITPAQLAHRQDLQPQTAWLGWGFEWQPAHAQRIHEVLAQQGDTVLPADATTGAIGAPWLHGVGQYETDIRLPLEHQAGHLLLVGTTGSFKTKLLLLLIFQAVRRGEAVLVIDPKGDRELRRALQVACQRAGRSQDFVYFHPAFPDVSARIGPWQRLVNYPHTERYPIEQ